MRHEHGFTLIELIVFIVVSGLLMTTILLGVTQALRKMPTLHQQWMAMQTAQTCMEWFLGQRRMNGYSALTCPSTPSAAACSAPSGLSVAASVACTTWNTDTNYKTITVTVGGQANTSVSTLIGDY